MKTMKKKNIFILSIAACTALLSSCELDAPNKSSLSPEVIFSAEVTAESAVMGIHQSFGETNSYRGRFIPYYGLNTDIEWINGLSPSKMPDNGKYDLTSYATTPTNTQMNTSNNAYAKLYEAIERANNGIKGLRAQSDLQSNPKLAQLLGELLTLRAVVYLDLIKAWGDVPARFDPITATTMYLPRTDRDDIYIQLLADLEEASSLVAWPNESTSTKSVERVSRAFVKGLRARIALYAGGYSQRADGVRLSTNPELERSKMYAIAKAECEDIINQGSNTLGNFKDNFLRLCKEDVTAGNESLWEIPFSEGRGRVLYTFGVKHNAADQYTAQAQGGINGPVPTLFYDYDVEDVRRDITCVPYEWSADSKAKQQLRSLNKWCFGKLRYEWMTRRVTSTNDDGINWQYMRLADVYLMAAEAINELEGPANAAKYLKPILDRALPAAKVNAYMTEATASKEAFFNTIVDQRALEFAGEQLRKADLIRWNLLKTKLDEAKGKMKQLAAREGVYSALPEKLYTRYAADGETLEIYGLNFGETDEIGKTMTDREATTWISLTKLDEALIESIYTQNPDENQVWPIWKTFIDASNGMLKNPF